ncbi:tRNA splicing endonuclease subunit sen2 [Oleoguttula sp. CCFEE 5521]
MGETKVIALEANGAVSHATDLNGYAIGSGPHQSSQTNEHTASSIVQLKPPQRPKKPNYQHIHRFPLPLQTYPLPIFHPTNPLSLLHLAYTYLSHLLSPPSSHPPRLYKATFHHESRSCHVTDPESIKALWEMGFFGKGTLSRSELTWEVRERAKRASGMGITAAEDATRRRRDERKAFKLERAREGAEKVALQRERERESEQVEGEAGLDEAEEVEAHDELPKHDARAEDKSRVDDRVDSAEPEGWTTPNPTAGDDEKTPLLTSMNGEVTSKSQALPPVPDTLEDDVVNEATFANEEHLQLTLEEAFFLAYGLGVLDIALPPGVQPIEGASPLSSPSIAFSRLLHTFAAHSTFPIQPSNQSLSPANPFFLHYATYHHFRSLGWVVRPGTKFSCDYLLYNRGPVFSHAEFAVIIIPAFEDEYWRTPDGIALRGDQKERDWWWLHCINRVQSQVKKTLVLCYVEVPAPMEEGRDRVVGVAEVLGRYKVREFVLKRWSMNRCR